MKRACGFVAVDQHVVAVAAGSPLDDSGLRGQADVPQRAQRREPHPVTDFQFVILHRTSPRQVRGRLRMYRLLECEISHSDPANQNPNACKSIWTEALFRVLTHPDEVTP